MDELILDDIEVLSGIIHLIIQFCTWKAAGTIHLMIQFCTWKAAVITLAPAVETVRAVESVRDLDLRWIICSNSNKYVGYFPTRVP